MVATTNIDYAASVKSGHNELEQLIAQDNRNNKTHEAHKVAKSVTAHRLHKEADSIASPTPLVTNMVFDGYAPSPIMAQDGFPISGSLNMLNDMKITLTALSTLGLTMAQQRATVQLSKLLQTTIALSDDAYHEIVELAESRKLSMDHEAAKLRKKIRKAVRISEWTALGVGLLEFALGVFTALKSADTGDAAGVAAGTFEAANATVKIGAASYAINYDSTHKNSVGEGEERVKNYMQYGVFGFAGKNAAALSMAATVAIGLLSASAMIEAAADALLTGALSIVNRVLITGIIINSVIQMGGSAGALATFFVHDQASKTASSYLQAGGGGGIVGLIAFMILQMKPVKQALDKKMGDEGAQLFTMAIVMLSGMLVALSSAKAMKGMAAQSEDGVDAADNETQQNTTQANSDTSTAGTVNNESRSSAFTKMVGTLSSLLRSELKSTRFLTLMHGFILMNAFNMLSASSASIFANIKQSDSAITNANIDFQSRLNATDGAQVKALADFLNQKLQSWSELFSEMAKSTQELYAGVISIIEKETATIMGVIVS